MKILKTSIKIAIISFILNIIWENSHASLFYWFLDYKSHFKMCLDATIWDVFLNLTMYFLLSLVFKNLYWFKSIKKKERIYITIFWLIIAFIFEKYALITWRWEYNEYMPIIPILWIWLSPALQMVIVPYFTFLFVWKKWKNLL